MKFDMDDFYPTPANLIGDMLSGVELGKVHTILEPSAGKGNIAKYIQKMKDEYRGHPFDIDAIEIDTDLQHVLKGEDFRVIHNDFLTFDTFKRYDLVIMNPPFSNGDRHLLHALKFVKAEGQLVCILNAETLKNPFTKTRQDLSRRLSELKADIRFVELAFADAERPTDVEVAIVRIDMPGDGGDSVILDHLRPAQDSRAPYAEPGNPLVASDRIRALVEHFTNEAEAGTGLIREYYAISRFMLKGTREKRAILELTVDDKQITEKCGHRRNAETNFLMSLRHRYWETLFSVPEFTAKLTSRVQEDLHSRVHEFAHYDFNFYNIAAYLADIDANAIIPTVVLADRKLRAVAWFGISGYANSEEENTGPGDPDWSPLAWAWQYTAEHIAEHIAGVAAEDIVQLYNGDREYNADSALADTLTRMFEIPLDTITTRAAEELYKATGDAVRDDMDAETVAEDTEPDATVIAVDVEPLADANGFVTEESIPYPPVLAEAQ